MKKLLSLFAKAALYLVAGVLGLLLFSGLCNGLLTSLEKYNHPFPGKMVSAGDTKVHVYTAGTGSDNVVLLSGLGTASPMLDFEALARELRKKSRVTILEYPGYGWSDDTNNLRLTANIVEEVRQALREANIPPPYVLVPHSISGLQSLYYANTYPEEVKGIVGLDISVPEQLNYMSVQAEPVNINKLLRLAGIVRVAFWIDPSLSGATSLGLSGEDIKTFSMITNWVVGSQAVYGETSQVSENLRSLSGLKFPRSIPVTLVLSSEGVDSSANGIPGHTWKAIHEDILTNCPDSKIVILQGGHYIHHRNEKQIAELVFELN
ncbi:MAG: alpha/beta hydrolase [Candidatus Omnitrophica bacterium]|nr:alpha/beta hydrolase [Candidatus Omnitrophota bacterium]